MNWKLGVEKDGAKYFVTTAYTVGERTVFTMRPTKDPMALPHLFASKEEAMEAFKEWQRSFPADATGWKGEAVEYES